MQTEVIKKLSAYIVAECSRVDLESRFDKMLDECYSLAEVGGPFACMCPSRVLKECDPTAYRCGQNDWADGEDFVEVDGETYERREVEKARDAFVADLESEATDLEVEIGDEEEDEDHSVTELAAKKRRLSDLQAEIQEAVNHDF